MAGEIEFEKLSLGRLQQFASLYGFPSSGSKKDLVARAEEFDKDIEERYNRLFAKYVPSRGSAETREGKLLRAVSKLIYRYYNDGDSFETTKEEHEDIFEDLHPEDKKFVDSYLRSQPSKRVTLADRLHIFNFLVNTLQRIKQMEATHEVPSEEDIAQLSRLERTAKDKMENIQKNSEKRTAKM